MSKNGAHDAQRRYADTVLGVATMELVRHNVGALGRCNEVLGTCGTQPGSVEVVRRRPAVVRVRCVHRPVGAAGQAERQAVSRVCTESIHGFATTSHDVAAAFGSQERVEPRGAPACSRQHCFLCTWPPRHRASEELHKCPLVPGVSNQIVLMGW